MTRQQLIKLYLIELLADNPSAIGKYQTITELFWQDAKELVERVER